MAFFGEEVDSSFVVQRQARFRAIRNLQPRRGVNKMVTAANLLSFASSARGPLLFVGVNRNLRDLCVKALAFAFRGAVLC